MRRLEIKINIPSEIDNTGEYKDYFKTVKTQIHKFLIKYITFQLGKRFLGQVTQYVLYSVPCSRFDLRCTSYMPYFHPPPPKKKEKT